MDAGKLAKARSLLAVGTGRTTRENRALPASIVDPQIPQRIGVAPVRLPKTTATPNNQRGFVTVEIAGVMAPRRFDPYTLATVEYPYGIGAVGYDVTRWASGWNVLDLFTWYDVVSFWGGKILINAAQLPALQIPSATLSAPAIPYAIPWQTGSEWGNGTANQAEKRVFAVGLTHVQAFNAGGTIEILSPAQPRADGKALSIGQRIDRTLHKAWLGQIYYTGSAWDSNGGSWQFSSCEVAMLLSAPYLQANQTTSAVDVSAPNFGSVIPGSGTRDVAAQFPPTPAAVTCPAGSAQKSANWTTTGGEVLWPALATIDVTFSGHVRQTYQSQTRSGSASQQISQAGIALTAASSTTKTWETSTDVLRIDSQTQYYFPPPQNHSLSGNVLHGPYNNLAWDSAQPTDSYAGLACVYTNECSPMGSGNVLTSDETQTGSATVSIGQINLIEISFGRSRMVTNTWSVTANTNYYDSVLNSPLSWCYQGSGMRGGRVSAYYSDAIDNGGPYDPSVHPEIGASVEAKFMQYRSVAYANNLNSNGVNEATGLYFYSIGEQTVDLNNSLSWKTVDYLLRDTANGVEIAILGEFSGEQTGPTGTATLTVTLRVTTRHHTNDQLLVTRTYYYADLLPEQYIQAWDKWYVPVPQLRAMYVPLAHEQGAFKGASYITAAEETHGSSPAHLFNFQLRLHTWSNVAQIGALNLTTDVVHTIPANLLELLYAYVFSQDYGIGRTTNQRYAVTESTRYNDLINTLFSDTYPVLVRDGVSGSWAGSLNGTSAGLYRT